MATGKKKPQPAKKPGSKSDAARAAREANAAKATKGKKPPSERALPAAPAAGKNANEAASAELTKAAASLSAGFDAAPTDAPKTDADTSGARPKSAKDQVAKAKAVDKAATTFHGDIVKTAVDAAKGIAAAWPKLTQAQQQQFIDSVERGVGERIKTFVREVAAEGKPHVVVELVKVDVSKEIKGTFKVSRADPLWKELQEHTGGLLLLSLSDLEQKHTGGVMPKGEREQRDLPLSTVDEGRAPGARTDNADKNDKPVADSGKATAPELGDIRGK